MPRAKRLQIAQTRGLWVAVIVFGALMNPLMLTGPIFMLQVYDRILPSQSVPTLLVIFALAGFLYAMMALLDSARVRILMRIAARLRVTLDRPVFDARLRILSQDPTKTEALGALQDLDRVYKALASPAMLAVLDTPWSFLFLGALFLFHPAMGAVALLGGLILVGLAIGGQWRTRHFRAQSQRATAAAERVVQALESDAHMMLAHGAEGAATAQWQHQRAQALTATLNVQDRVGVDGAVARAFRMFMQTATLAAGAWLVLQGQLSAGLIVAASILMGRALAPVEQLATQWSDLRAAQSAWQRVQGVMASAPEIEPMQFKPGYQSGPLSAHGVVVTPRGGGAPILRIKGFEVTKGTALGVIGSSGSGKSLLAKVMIGSMPVATGVMRLGDLVLPIPPPVTRALGYMPQQIALFPGSIAENISGFDPDATQEAIECAARAAGLHDMIVAMPRGYGAVAAGPGCHLSGGQVQRLGLARALYGDPGFVILDEPTAHLDADGSAALNAAIYDLKARGAVVVVMALRPTAISVCDMLMVLDKGAQIAFGPRDTVLRDMVRNHTAVVPSAAGGRL